MFDYWRVYETMKKHRGFVDYWEHMAKILELVENYGEQIGTCGNFSADAIKYDNIWENED